MLKKSIYFALSVGTAVCLLTAPVMAEQPESSIGITEQVAEEEASQSDREDASETEVPAASVSTDKNDSTASNADDADAAVDVSESLPESAPEEPGEEETLSDVSEVPRVEIIPLYRVYNPNSGEHFYTKSLSERTHLISLGWHDEGVGWYGPSSSEIPVYRLYNPNGGEHHYTMNQNEQKQLISLGWRDEGIGWYSDPEQKVVLYRTYNPNSGQHHYTTNAGERDYIVKAGWSNEGTAWYASREGHDASVDVANIYQGKGASLHFDSEAAVEEGAVTPQMFGAVGDGKADDTNALQRAFDTLREQGGTIYIPSGVYRITRSLLIYSNQTITSNGARLLEGSSIDNMMRNYNNGKGGYTASENIHVSGLIFDGGSFSNNNTLLCFAHSTNILIEQCEFRNGYGRWHDIEINSTKQAVIQNCVFSAARRHHVNACQIQVDSYNNTATWPWGDGKVDGTVSDTVEIRGCYFRGNRYTPAIGNHSVATVRHIRIHDNVFTDFQSQRGTIIFQSASDVMVENNTFIRCNIGVNSAAAVRNNRFNNCVTPYSSKVTVL